MNCNMLIIRDIFSFEIKNKERDKIDFKSKYSANYRY